MKENKTQVQGLNSLVYCTAYAKWTITVWNV